jgi:hypothetical protein
MNDLFANSLNCVCGPGGPTCFCDDQERLLRAHAFAVRPLPPLTTAQREVIASNADHDAEGGLHYDEIITWSDQDLCAAAMQAMSDYVNSNCL